MIYTIKDIDEIKNVNLHDFEILNINVDYIEKSVVLLMKSPMNEVHMITVARFYNISIGGFEPWGEGGYINSFKISKDLILAQENKDLNYKIFSIDILMNSGDLISVSANELIYV